MGIFVLKEKPRHPNPLDQPTTKGPSPPETIDEPTPEWTAKRGPSSKADIRKSLDKPTSVERDKITGDDAWRDHEPSTTATGQEASAHKLDHRTRTRARQGPQGEETERGQ